MRRSSNRIGYKQFTTGFATTDPVDNLETKLKWARLVVTFVIGFFLSQILLATLFTLTRFGSQKPIFY